GDQSLLPPFSTPLAPPCFSLAPSPPSRCHSERSEESLCFWRQASVLGCHPERSEGSAFRLLSRVPLPCVFSRVRFLTLIPRFIPSLSRARSASLQPATLFLLSF